MGVRKLKVWLNTIAICEPVDFIELEAFKIYILPLYIKLKCTEIERMRSKILSG